MQLKFTLVKGGQGGCIDRYMYIDNVYIDIYYIDIQP